MDVDPISALMGAGPLGAILAWALWELRDMRRALQELIEENAKSNQALADALEDLKEVINDRNRDEIRKVALEELRAARRDRGG